MTPGWSKSETRRVRSAAGAPGAGPWRKKSGMVTSVGEGCEGFTFLGAGGGATSRGLVTVLIGDDICNGYIAPGLPGNRWVAAVGWIGPAACEIWFW